MSCQKKRITHTINTNIVETKSFYFPYIVYSQADSNMIYKVSM